MKAGWTTAPLGELCEFQRGLTYAKNDEVPESDVVVLRANNVDLETNTLDLSDLRYIANSVNVPKDKKVKKDSLLICTASGSKSHLGKVAFIDDDYGYAFGGFMGQITPKPQMDGRYLFHVMTSPAYKDFISALSDGANINTLKFNDLRNFQVAIPTIAEQRRIVTLLDDAFADIVTVKANAEKNLQNARELFNSHLDAIIFHAQENGKTVPLSELATDITDGDHMPPPKAEQGLPFITIGNIDKQKRTIDFSDTFKVPREYFDALKANKKPMRGDVLYTVTGSFGIPVLVEDDKEFCFQRHIGLIRPKADVDSTWLHYLLQSPQVFNQASDGATGTAQKTVSLKVLRNLQVPRISPKEQSAHVVSLRNVERECRRLESIYGQKLTALDELKKSLLHQAFSGQL